jgi:hypothetical protein
MVNYFKGVTTIVHAKDRLIEFYLTEHFNRQTLRVINAQYVALIKELEVDK